MLSFLPAAFVSALPHLRPDALSRFPVWKGSSTDRRSSSSKPTNQNREEGGDEHAAADAHEDRQAQRPDVELRRALERRH